VFSSTNPLRRITSGTITTLVLWLPLTKELATDPFTISLHIVSVMVLLTRKFESCQVPVKLGFGQLRLLFR
jgi:hypothetical protein